MAAESTDGLGFVVSDQDISTIQQNSTRIRYYKDLLVLMGYVPGGSYETDIVSSITSLLLLQSTEISRLQGIFISHQGKPST